MGGEHGRRLPDQRGQAPQEIGTNDTFGERVVANARRINVITSDGIVSKQVPRFMRQGLTGRRVPTIDIIRDTEQVAKGLLEFPIPSDNAYQNQRRHLFVHVYEDKIHALVTHSGKPYAGMLIEGLDRQLVDEFIRLINIPPSASGSTPDPDATIGSIIDALFANHRSRVDGAADTMGEEEQRRIRARFPRKEPYSTETRSKRDFQLLKIT